MNSLSLLVSLSIHLYSEARTSWRSPALRVLCPLPAVIVASDSGPGEGCLQWLQNILVKQLGFGFSFFLSFSLFVPKHTCVAKVTSACDVSWCFRKTCFSSHETTCVQNISLSSLYLSISLVVPKHTCVDKASSACDVSWLFLKICLSSHETACLQNIYLFSLSLSSSPSPSSSPNTHVLPKLQVRVMFRGDFLNLVYPRMRLHVSKTSLSLLSPSPSPSSSPNTHVLPKLQVRVMFRGDFLKQLFIFA